jgi:hypothetical protein
MQNLTNKKITMATVKSFIKKNATNLYIKCDSAFDGMVDCITYNASATFEKVTLNENVNNKFNLGIEGAWFVGSSRDYLKAYELNDMICIDVTNCCGSFVIATTK